MAVLWGSGNCRLNLETATFAQIVAAVRCEFPGASPAEQTRIAVSLYEQKLALLLAGKTQAEIAQLTEQLLVTADENIRELLEKTLIQSSQSAQAITNKALSGITTATGKAGDVLSNIGSSVTKGISGLVTGAANTLGGLGSKIGTDVATLLGGAAATLAALTKRLIGDAGTFIEQAGAGAGRAFASVLRAVEEFLGPAVELAERLAASVADFLADAAGGFSALATTLLAKITGLAPDLVALASNIAGELTRPLTGTVETVGSFLTDPVGGVLGSFFGDSAADLSDRVEGLIARMERNPATPPELRRLTAPGALPAVPIVGLVLALALPTILGTALSTLMQPVLLKMVQEENLRVRPTLLGLSDAVAAVYRGERPPAYLLDVAARTGYTDADAELAVEVLRPLPTVGDLMDWRFRRFISEGEARAGLAAHGFTAEQVDAYLRAAEIIPPLSDLVRFAVREAFPGQVGYGGARGANVPARFAEVAAELGLTDEFARSYWAAHWDLPAAGQGFEMLHRGIIAEADLRQLLIELDLAPEWVERMIALSYNPLTRVDVRRMYDLGILSAADVERAYLDLGYSPTDAAALREFVVRLGKDAEDLATTPERDLTRGDLLGMYRDGLLTPPAARDQLLAIGYSGTEADLLIAREDLRAVLDNRRRLREQIVDQAVAGVISFEEAQDRLAAAGLETNEVALTMRRIVDEQGAASARPSRAELGQFFKAGVIDVEVYKAELRRLGYAEQWVEAYAKTVKKGPAAAV